MGENWCVELQDMVGWVNFTERPETAVKCSILFGTIKKLFYIFTETSCVMSMSFHSVNIDLLSYSC